MPEGWKNMQYEKFLEERRRLMAEAVKMELESLVSGHGIINADNLPTDRWFVSPRFGGGIGNMTNTMVISALRLCHRW